MNALKIIKRLKNTTLEELKPYIGEKVEIIVLPLDDKKKDTLSKSSLRDLFSLIDSCAGTMTSYKREELYDR